MLQVVFTLPLVPSRLITDGQVGNEAEVTELIRKGSNTRLFTVGIGYGPNEYFIKQIARTGGGKSVLIAPEERIEPRILGLFKSIMGGSINDLSVDLGEDTEQAPHSPVVFTGDVISILARVSDDSEFPEEVIISGRMGDIDKRFRVRMQKICGEEMPTPLLWAREIIRDIEEGATGISGSGSKQAQRKENRVREKIIEISKEFGLISRETSFIAIERREDKDKTSGEVVLRKVPVLLTKGWHGREPVNLQRIRFDIGEITDYTIENVGQRLDVTRDRMRQIEANVLRKLIHPSRSNRLRSFIDDIDYSRINLQDILLKILSVQQAEGGFKITKEVAKIIGIYFPDLKEDAKKIEVDKKADRFKLLSTALILTLLKKRFLDMKELWFSIVQKSEIWYIKELERTKPCIEGLSLQEWVDILVRKLQYIKGF